MYLQTLFARLLAEYSSKAAQNTEEPVPNLASLTSIHSHFMRDGTRHPVQVGHSVTV